MKSKNGELIGFVDVGGFAGVDEGRAVVKPLEVSVNREMNGIPTRFSERVHGERIEVYKTQLPASRNSQMSAVSKEWEEVQKPFGEKSSNVIQSPNRNYSAPEHNEPHYSQADTPLGQLKNHLDKVHDHVRWLWAGLVLVGILSALSLGLALK